MSQDEQGQKCEFCGRVSALVMAGALAVAVFLVRVKK